MKIRDEELLLKLKEYCDEIFETVNRFGDDFETFCGDRVFYLSSSWSVMFIGFICRDLSDDFKDKHSDIPWDKLNEMSRQLLSKFETVDKWELWSIIKTNIPLLYEHI